MYIKNRFAALIYRAALTAACFTGLYLHTVKNGAVTFSSYAYYTLLSNAACFLYFLPLTVKTAAEYHKLGRDGVTSLAPVGRGIVTMMITVTMIIYHILLTPSQFSMEEMISMLTAANLMVHYVVPVMVMTDWLLFEVKGRYRRQDPLVWMAAPLLYFLFILVRAQSGALFSSGSRYPYFFIDVDALGWGGVGRWLLAISLFFAGLGYAYYLLDHSLTKNRKVTSRQV